MKYPDTESQVKTCFDFLKESLVESKSLTDLAKILGEARLLEKSHPDVLLSVLTVLKDMGRLAFDKSTDIYSLTDKEFPEVNNAILTLIQGNMAFNFMRKNLAKDRSIILTELRDNFQAKGLNEIIPEPIFKSVLTFMRETGVISYQGIEGNLDNLRISLIKDF